MSKSWYTSKTLWLNLIAIIIFIVEYSTQQSWVTVSISGLVIGVLNMINRFLTSQPVGK